MTDDAKATDIRMCGKTLENAYRGYVGTDVDGSPIIEGKADARILAVSAPDESSGPYSDDDAYALAEMQGGDDARAGIKLAQCPYPRGSVERDGWLAGWKMESGS